jgi:mono/diheme cytochrome c family protein
VTAARRSALLPWLAVAVLLGGCGRNMVDQPRLGTQQASPFFADGVGARLPVAGTVAREVGGIDPVFFTGQGPAGFVTEMPVELTVDLLRRGQERYDIYCALCHGYTGESDGMIVSRGFPAPTSFQDPRLLEAPVGYFFGVMTDGFGRMFPYASRIPAEDRWAIAGYVKALQLSQNASPDDVPPDVRLQLAPTEGRLR